MRVKKKGYHYKFIKKFVIILLISEVRKYDLAVFGDSAINASVIFKI